MYVINFKLFIHKGQDRPFNFSHAIETEVERERAEHILGHGYEFHLHIHGPRSSDKVLLAIARPEGEHIVTASIDDIDADSLDAVLPKFLKEGLALTHADLHHVFPHPRDITREIGNVRNDIGSVEPFAAPLDYEGRD